MTMDPTLATTAGETALNPESIKQIKEVMDGFDPAALLPEMNSIFSKLLLACRIAVVIGPVILLVLGLGYLLLAPKEANYYFGYRCYFGMGSIHAWRFTQRIAGIAMTGLGTILLVVMIFMAVRLGSLEQMAMVWSAVKCLIWQAALTIAVTVFINVVVAVNYNANGELRKKAPKVKKEK